MKATLYSKVVTLVKVTSDFKGIEFPAGSFGVVVESFVEPREGYYVDLALANDDGSLAEIQNVTLFPEQFEVV